MCTNSILATPANLSTLRGLVSSSSARSAWSRGVRAYALDLLDNIEEMSNYEMNNYGEYLAISEAVALNGAGSWSNYAAGGCGLVYTSAICRNSSTLRGSTDRTTRTDQPTRTT